MKRTQPHHPYPLLTARPTRWALQWPKSWVPVQGVMPNERLLISEDRRTLDFQFRTSSEDALRVIVREPLGAQP